MSANHHPGHSQGTVFRLRISADAACRMHGGSSPGAPKGQSEYIQARSLYGGGNCATAGDFSTDPGCSRLRVKKAVSSTAKATYQSQFNDLTQTILTPKSCWRSSNKFLKHRFSWDASLNPIPQDLD